MSELTEHALRNRAYWDRTAGDWVEPGRRNWASDAPVWGIWAVPERELGVLADVELDGADVIELGCGTAYWSAWLARRGARPVGLDNSRRQLDTARGLQREHGLEFPLVHGSAESAPFPDGSFDVAFSEYGASIWCDPRLWIPEAARLLRPGGRLVYLANSTLLMLCTPDDGAATDRLVRDHFGMHRFEWPEDGGSAEFHLPHGESIRLLRSAGLAVDDLIDVRAPAGAPPTRFEYVSPEWARRWPSEEIWKATRTA